MARKKQKARTLSFSSKKLQERVLQHVEKFIDRLTVRDVIYGTTFGLGAWHLYNMIPKKVWVIENNETGAKKYISMSWAGYCPFGHHCYAEETDRFMLPHAAQSCLAVYMLMKTDVSDVVGALSKIGAGLGQIT